MKKLFFFNSALGVQRWAFGVFFFLLCAASALAQAGNSAMMLKPPVSGRQDVFQDINFTSTHPFSYNGTVINFGNGANQTPKLDSAAKLPFANIPTAGWPSLAFGNTTATATATPLNLNLGGTYSNSASLHPKIILFDNGTVQYGLGVSSGQMEFMLPSSAVYKWYVNSVQVMLADSAGAKSRNLTITGDGSNPNQPLWDLGGNLHFLLPYSVTYDDSVNPPSSAFGAIKWFTNDSNSPEAYFQSTIWHRTSLNRAKRGLVINSITQNLGWENVFIQPDPSAHVVIGDDKSRGGLFEIHEATNKNISFRLSSPGSRLGMSALNDAANAFVDLEIQANSVLFTQGPVSFGNTTPDAGWITIQGGTASRGAIQIKSGTLTTVHWPGLIENDGTWLYYTNDAASRQLIATDVNFLTFTNKTFGDGVQFGGNLTFAPNNSHDIGDGTGGHNPRTIHLAGTTVAIDGSPVSGAFTIVGGTGGGAINNNANSTSNLSWNDSGDFIVRGTMLLNQTGLILKGGDANTVNIKINETETAARTFNLKLHDADRTIDLTGNLTLAASFTTTGTSATTFALPSSGTPTYTFPAASQTIASLAGTETFTNKTLTSPTLGGTIAGTPTWGSSQAITLSTASQPNITSVGPLTNLGIGAAAQSHTALRVHGGTDMNLWVRNDQSNLYLQAGNDGGSASVPVKFDASSFEFISTGAVQVNMLKASAAAYVNQTGDIGAARSGGTTGVYYLGDTGTRYLYYDGTNYSLPGGSLVVNGTTYTSDASLKQNIADWKPADRAARKLRPRIYQRKESPKKNEIGLVAQEVQAIMPDAVEPVAIDPKDPKKTLLGIKENALLTAILAELQQQGQEIEALQAKPK